MATEDKTMASSESETTEIISGSHLDTDSVPEGESGFTEIPALDNSSEALADLDVPTMDETKLLLEQEGVLAEGGDDDAITALKNMEEKRKRAKRNRMIKIIVAAAVVLLALILFLLRDTLFPAPTEDAEPETMEVTRQEFTTSVQGSGSLKAGSTVVVTPEVSGIIDEVLVTEGQHVEQGDILVTLRNADLDKGIAAAADEVSAASTSVYNAQVAVSDLQQSYSNAVDDYNWSVEQNAIDVSNAKVAGDVAYQETYDEAIANIPEDATKEERKRLKEEAKEKAQQAYQEAYDSVPITEIMEYDDASYVSQIDSAQSSVIDAQNTLSKAQESYDQAVEEADKRNVKAPAAGTVLALEAVPGAAVGSAEGGTSQSSGSLMQISDMTRLKVSIEVNEVDILSVAEGQKAKVTFSAIPDLELDATVVSVASVATGSGGDSGDVGGGGVATFTVQLDIDQVDERLKPGMTTTVRILTQDEKDVLVVPTAALIEDGETAYVQVVTSEEPLETEQREVKVGARSSSDAVIVSGLEEGETIAYGGASSIGGSDDDALDGDGAAA